MTGKEKDVLKRETAVRLRKPYADSLVWLAKCRRSLHALDPKKHENRFLRKNLFISARSWAREARAARYALEAAGPDSQNDRVAA